jgi:BirA family biotin operon repressor/biotin-[acetyl-CoA-carboxylase] ligase
MTIGSTVIHHDRVSSTNSVASAMMREGKSEDGTVITASFQESGRGQAGNTWESEPGKNLLISVILHPAAVKPEEQFVISQFVSLAVCDLVGRYAPDVAVKWPNDIYCGNRKIAGILIEHSIIGPKLAGSVAGIGLNVNQLVFTGGAPNPVSLAMLTGSNHDLARITRELTEQLDSRYRMVTGGEWTRLEEEYQQLLYRRGEWHSYSDSSGIFRGMIESVRNDGMLMMRRENGSLRDYAFKEVDYIL